MKPKNTTGERMLLALAVAILLMSSACSAPAEHTSPGPGSAALTADAVVESATCAAHGAPAELCFICDASLREPNRLWCREHDRYEDRCWECHPDLRDEARLWCDEHSLYEDECFLCRPELLEATRTPGEGAAASGADNEGSAVSMTAAVGQGMMCHEHGVPESECGICHPELLARGMAGPGLKVRMASPESAMQAGVAVQPPEMQTMENGVSGFAELTFNQNRLARITSLVEGVITGVQADLGTRVKAGDLLATVTSAAIGEAQSEFLRALAEEELRRKTFERESELLAQRVTSQREYQEAEAAHRAAAAALRQARQRLLVLGFEDSRIDEVAGEPGAAGVLELRAPFPGEVVDRQAVLGDVVDIADVLFTVTDTSLLWAMVNIPESQLPRVKTGQAVTLTVDSLPERTFPGTLTWLSATVSRRTRMARGRVEVANPGGELKAQMFAQAHIATTRSERALVVPLSAVQEVTGTSIVFVKFADDLFEARPVILGATRDGHVEIAAGLGPGEPVVVRGGFALKSQLLASRLGAGCVDP